MSGSIMAMPFRPALSSFGSNLLRSFALTASIAIAGAWG